MKSLLHPPFFIVIFLLIQGCNTMLNTRTINIEVLEPGKLIFPSDNKNVVLRYNNSNVSYNPVFSKHYENLKIFPDSTNIDSIASKIYFQAFAENLKNQNFFDSIQIISSGNYSGRIFSDSLETREPDSTKLLNSGPASIMLGLLKKFPGKSSPNADTILINPQLGLYSKNDLREIADSTQADFLISLDYFASFDVKWFIPEFLKEGRSVYSQGLWVLYDLELLKMGYFNNRIDTVSWENIKDYELQTKSKLPPRRDAILNAAEISGTKFAEIIVPHWSETQRVYYRSGHIEMKKAEPLILKGKWMEAAKIWKSNIDNKNKSIAAKSMFNLGLACEMEGQLDAAIDWVVKSFHISGQKNSVNRYNCTEYLKILGQRKQDLKRIEAQMNPEFSPVQ